MTGTTPAARRRHRRAGRARHAQRRDARRSTPTRPSRPSSSCIARGSDRTRRQPRAARRHAASARPRSPCSRAPAAARSLVAALPRVAVISTGDELVDVDEPIAPHQIRSSNDRAIEASLDAAPLGRRSRARGCATMPTRSRSRSIASTPSSDVLVLSGGVSMGQFDFVPSVLDGARRQARVPQDRASGPGRPMWFGVSARGKPIFALPGNPVSTLVCATRYLVPALRAAAGLAAAAARARRARGADRSVAGR